MGRDSAKKISIDPNVRCLKVYPKAGSHKALADLKTIGMKMSRDQAIHLARVLLAVTQNWEEIDITAYRRNPRHSDKTFQVTVTSYRGHP